MNPSNDFRTRKSRDPGFVFPAARTYFGDNYKMCRVGMQRLLDDLIRDVRTIEIGRVDVIYAARNHFTQNGYRLINVFAWSLHELASVSPG